MKPAVDNIWKISRLPVPADFLKRGQNSFGAQDAVVRVGARAGPERGQIRPDPDSVTGG